MTIVVLLAMMVGFKTYKWFLSIGNAFAIGAIGITLFLYCVFVSKGSLIDYLECVALIIYGTRFAMVLIKRRNKLEYRLDKAKRTSQEKESIIIKIFIWIYFSFLYLCQCLPVVYNLANPNLEPFRVWQLVGCLMMIVALIGEDVADDQKSRSKRERPNSACMIGLHRMCRFPSYFFEIVFWSGVFISSVDAVFGLQWILVAIGYLMAMLVYINRVIQLEKRHLEKYGNDSEYQHYADTTPILIPLIPIYHLFTNEKPETKEEEIIITEEDLN